MLVYVDDVETTALPNELSILGTIFESLESAHFGDIVENHLSSRTCYH